MRTIRAKITAFTIALSILFAVTVGIVFYSNFQKLLIENMLAVSNANIRLVMDTLDEDIKSAQSIVEWSTINSDLNRLLLMQKTEPGQKREMLAYLNELRSVAGSSSVGDRILKLIIAGEDGFTMQLGSVYGHGSDIERCEASTWFRPLLKDESLLWPGIVERPFAYGGDGYMIPAVRPVYSYLRRENVGWVLIAIDSDLLLEYMKRYASYEDSEVVIFNRDGQILAHKDTARIGSRLVNIADVLAQTGESGQGTLEWEGGEGGRPATYYRSGTTGWYILQTLSITEIEEQKRVFYNIIFLTVLALIVLGTFLSAFLGGHINQPIRKINAKVKQIAGGDFSRLEEIESDDEIGEIGKGINRMSEDIRDHMDQAVRDEKAKRELELRVLQTQVNPHFLYNTLNSIKWMATIQKNTGIGEMATALSRLLRNMAKGVSAEIPLREELSLVEDYVLIQQFRYSGQFNVRYEVDENVLDCRIIKFTLQPIVENAIFHGIAPKNRLGTIVIRAGRRDGEVHLSVRDNGVGIAPEAVNDILSNTAIHSGDSLNSIGVANVNERIRMSYGEQYGLAIRSFPEEGTEVAITIPVKE